MGWKDWASAAVEGAAIVAGVAAVAAAKTVVAPAVVVVGVVGVAIVNSDKIVDVAEKVVKTAVEVGEKVVETAVEVGEKVVETAVEVGEKVVKPVVDAGKEVGKKISEDLDRLGRAVAREAKERLDLMLQTATTTAQGVPASGVPAPAPPAPPTPPSISVPELPPLPPAAAPVLAAAAEAPAMAEEAAAAASTWSWLNPSTWTRGQQVAALGILIVAAATGAWKWRRERRAAQVADATTASSAEATTPLVDPVRPAPPSTSRPNPQAEPRRPDEDNSLINREPDATEEVMDPAYFKGYLQARASSTNSASGQPSKRDQTPDDRSAKRQKTAGSAASGAPEPPDRQNGQNHTEEQGEEGEEDKENSEKKAPPKKKLKCMVWNSGGIGRNSGYPHSIDDVIRLDKPDIIILNENKSDENLDKFAAKHGYKYVCISSPRPRTRGTAILYRPDAGFTFGPAVARVGRAGDDDHAIEVIAVDISLASGFQCRLIATYIHRGLREYCDEAEVIYEEFASAGGHPTFIAGDMNMREFERWSRQGYHSALDDSWTTNRKKKTRKQMLAASNGEASTNEISRTTIDRVMTRCLEFVVGHRPIEPDMTSTDGVPTTNVHSPIIFEIGDVGEGGPCADPHCELCTRRQ